jgi:hypothetical protein
LSGAASRTMVGVTIGSRAPAYSRTGAVSFVGAALVAGESKAAPAKKPSRAGWWRSLTPAVACAWAAWSQRS